MSQTRAMSWLESITNLVAGFLLALVTQILLFRFMGLDVSLASNIGITVLFSALSLIRSYTVRRMFNLLGNNQSCPDRPT